MKFSLDNFKKVRTTKSAFSLVELLISISIIGMMAAISISAYPKFSEQITVSSETYKFLAYMKEAQVYGVSSYSTPGVKMYYGVKVVKAENLIKRLSWENPDKLRDSNKDLIDNLKDTTEATQNLKNSFEIEKICDTEDCTNVYDTAIAVYKRPNPEGRLLGLQGTSIQPDSVGKKSLERIVIFVRSKRNIAFVKKIVILQTGQMYVSDW